MEPQGAYAGVYTRYAQIVHKAKTDEAFRERLLADPAAVLRAEGVEVPDELEIRVVENTDYIIHLILPSHTVGSLSDEDLESASGGSVFFPDTNPPRPLRWDQ